MMKRKLKGLSLLLLTALATNIARADLNDIQIGIPGYGGTGCPAGSASVTLTDDKKTLSIIFDQFQVEAGGANQRIARKACNLAIPVHVPQGFSVSVVDADYRGYVSLPDQAQARLTAEYFLAGTRGPVFSKLFIGRTDTDYLFTNTIGINGVVWSACGADAILRVNASMLVQTNRFNDQALATVDSADYKGSILYKLQWKTCR